MNKNYTIDGVHVNESGYAVMENIILKAIDNAETLYSR